MSPRAVFVLPKTGWQKSKTTGFPGPPPLATTVPILNLPPATSEKPPRKTSRCRSESHQPAERIQPYGWEKGRKQGPYEAASESAFLQCGECGTNEMPTPPASNLWPALVQSGEHSSPGKPKHLNTNPVLVLRPVRKTRLGTKANAFRKKPCACLLQFERLAKTEDLCSPRQTLLSDISQSGKNPPSGI